MSIYIGLCMLLFVLMMVLPFVPGWLEMRRKKDIRHLYINGDFVRNPRYFSTSFKQKLLGTGSLSILKEEQEVMLSKKEILIQADKLTAGQKKFENLVFFNQQPELLPGSVFHKEIYARQNIQFPEETLLRAAACEENCRLGKSSRVIRWIDAERQMEIAENCQLDLSATAGEHLLIASGCRFRRLYAPMIDIQGGASRLQQMMEIAGTQDGLQRDVNHIEAGQVLGGNVVAKGDFTLHEGAVLVGSLKVYGDLLLEEGSQIQGNVFGEKRIRLLGGNWIRGSIFSQGRIEAGPGCIFGHADAVESVVARNGIVFSSHTTVYGFVLTEGEGSIL